MSSTAHRKCDNCGQFLDLNIHGGSFCSFACVDEHFESVWAEEDTRAIAEAELGEDLVSLRVVTEDDL